MTRAALCLFVASCAATSPAVERRAPNILDVPPVAAYVLPAGLESFPAVPVALPRPGILVSEAEVTRSLLARSELEARRVEGRALRAVLTVERTWASSALEAERARAERALLTSSRWQRWGPLAVATAIMAGVVIGVSR
jgi:hypothetical protein